MIKSYISTLLTALVAVAQITHAQDDMDGVFGQLDGAGDAGNQPAAVETAVAADVQQAPAISETEMISLLHKKGAREYKAGNYDEAIRAFDAILAIDKYNTDASAYRARVSQRINSKELKKLETSRAQAFSEVHAAWNPPAKALGSVDLSSDSTELSPNEQAVQQMIARLKAISIPSLDFSNASIEDVVLFLTESSRQLDSSGKGANILLIGMETSTGSSSITTAITDINLYDALSVIVEMASLQLEVKPNAVAIMPSNYVPASEMVMRSYDIVPDVGSDLEAFSGDSGGVDDLFGDAPAAAATGPVDVAGFFSIVDFPEGSSAIYQPRFHKLFVKNTPKNLKGIESVLTDLVEEAIKRRSQQVEIETKFVEFNEGALEELGFDWNMYGSGSSASMQMDGRDVLNGSGHGGPGVSGKTYAIDPITGQKILSDTMADGGRPGQNVFGSTHRNNNTAFDAVGSGLLGLMGGTPASMMFGNGDIDVKITAMEQEGTADVLSAPKVTTKSGNEAIIRVAETHRYPQDYDVETGQRTAPVVKPQDWEDFDLGVSLRVTPVVDSESNTIDLDLQPEIVKFIGFDEYIVGYNSQQFIGPGGGQTVDDPTLRALMPFFERRFVQTQVTIADGSTVVMGGLVDERTETFRDQVPFLGDIPYLGRLFRSEGSRTSKKNLTIFVKATQVDARGMTREQRKLAQQ